MKMVKLKYLNGYLQVVMPDGQVIPEQVDIKIENEVGQRKIATVTVTLIADISQIVEYTNSESDLRESIEDLREKLDLSHKSAIFWEKKYMNETYKKWYQKLFNL